VARNYKVGVILLEWRRQCSDQGTDYFTKLLEDDLKAVVKPQYVDQIPKAVRAPDKSVQALIESRSQMDNLKEVCDVLGE
jgi:ATP-binding cassette subfamily E protein 1